MSEDLHSDGFPVAGSAETRVADELALRGLPVWTWALLILVLGMAATLWAATRQFQHMREQHEAGLADIVARSEEALAARLANCGLLLRSMQTVFSASHDVSAAEFAAAYDSLRPREVMPSLQAVGYAGRERRADGEHYINTMIAPLQGNTSVLGLDLGSQPGNMVAVRRSRDTGLPASRLHLELTETAVISDEAHASALLATLHRTGVKVWLDDFGTGFSGLSHLRRVPVDGVKIDRSFIADMLRDPDDLALTTAIIAMAHSLGITVVAEGVEKEGQFNLLRERGCDLAQGYWLGYPVTATEFAQLVA